MTILGKVLDMTGGPTKNMPGAAFVLPTCYTGVEFECEGVSHQISSEKDQYFYWKGVADGSLRGPSIEYVLRSPLYGEDLEDALQYLCSEGRRLKYRCTYRTSMHVHIDVRDLTFQQLKALLFIYAIVEPALYNYVGNARDASNFCLPWYSADVIAEQIAKLILINNEDVQKTKLQLKFINELNARYSGLNIASVAKYGSVEFRHQLCTFDIKQVVEWINICQSIKKAAIEYADTDWDNILGTVSSTGPEEFIKKIFADKELWRVLEYPSLGLDVFNKGVSTCNLLTAHMQQYQDSPESLWRYFDEAEPAVNNIKSRYSIIRDRLRAPKPKPNKRKQKAPQAAVGGPPGAAAADGFIANRFIVNEQPPLEGHILVPEPQTDEQEEQL